MTFRAAALTELDIIIQIGSMYGIAIAQLCLVDMSSSCAARYHRN